MAHIAQKAPAPARVDHPHRLRGADAFRLHLTLVLGLALCIGAFTFELIRALGGHTFSWMYVFEWPLFAAFALYMWWNLFNGNDRRRPASPEVAPPADASARGGPPPDPDLESWNRYLELLEAEDAEDDPSSSGG